MKNSVILIFGLLSAVDYVQAKEVIVCKSTEGNITSYAEIYFDLQTGSKNEASIENLVFKDHSGEVFAAYPQSIAGKSSQMFGNRYLEFSLGVISYLDLVRPCKKIAKGEYRCANQFTGTFLLSRNPLKFETHVQCVATE